MRLHDYLRRVGLTPPAAPTLEALRALHVAHRETFLFENLTIQAGGAISVAPDDIERKFLDERRGGYCFEHNTLFHAVLREVGFETVSLLGRVRRGPPERWCRTHMVLRVDVDAAPWLADVGFGGLGLVEPMPLHEGASSSQVGLTYMLRRERELWILSMQHGGLKSDLYEFSDDAQTAGDVEVANHYTSTHPNSIFRRALTIQRASRRERVILRHDLLTRYRDGRMEERPFDLAELNVVAREEFGVELPAGPWVFTTYETVS